MTAPPQGPALVVLAAGRARRYGGVKPLAPIGPTGEAVVDLLASDALGAGFSTVVLVIGPSTGAAIRYHVERTWPSDVDVRFALQAAPIGTVDAVLCGVGQLDAGASVGVANADDLYGHAGLALLASHLAGGDATNAMVGYRLRNAVVGDSPVTRGVCEVDGDGMLRSISERRQVTAVGDGRFISKDGEEPAELDGDALVSMNLWGLRTDVTAALGAAMSEAQHASEDAEVLLPVVIDSLLGGARPGGVETTPFRVLAAGGRCVGVTHPEDLGLVRADIAAQVGQGDRPATLWGATG